MLVPLVSSRSDRVKNKQAGEHKSPATGKAVIPMLGWALMFFIFALIAGIFGFMGIASAAAGIAKVLFVIFVVLFLASLILGRRKV